MVKLKRILKITLIFVLVYVIGGLTIVDIGYTILGFNNKVEYSSIKSASEYGLISEEKDLVTSDNVKIHIYEVEAYAPRGVIIMLTGITGPSVTHFYGMSELFFINNYSSILVDVRGHGKSDGDSVSFGIEETRDVEAVVNYIKSKDVYDTLPVIVLGTSMGGAIAVNSASLIDGIDGLISIASFSSWTDANVDMVESRGFPRIVGDFLRPAINLYGYLRFGQDYFRYAPVDNIKNIGDKPVLLMQSIGDPEVSVKSFNRLYKAYGKETDVWIRQNNHHFVVNSGIHDPMKDKEFCNKIMDWIEANFT